MAKSTSQAPPEIPPPKILRAFKPGDIMFLECPQVLSVQQMQHLNAEFKRLVPQVKVVILQAGIKVAAREEEPIDPMPKAWTDVLDERRRQVTQEGWTPEHDDEHSACDLAVAGGCYALFTDSFPNIGQPPPEWPWAAEWWKPADYRRDMVKAAALLLAEIERVDRQQDMGAPR